MNLLPLDSDRWKELGAEDIADAVVSLEEASKERHMDLVADEWSYLHQTLWNQGTIYPYSYAAIPHLFEIAERTIIRNRAELLILAGVICSDNSEMFGTVDSDIRENFWQSIEKLKVKSLEIIDEVARRNLFYKFPLCRLLMGFCSIRFDNCFWLAAIDMLSCDSPSWWVSCSNCKIELDLSIIDGQFYAGSDESMKPLLVRKIDSSERTALLKEGQKLLQCDEHKWTEINILNVASALAHRYGDGALSGRILDLLTPINCPNCTEDFLLTANE